MQKNHSGDETTTGPGADLEPDEAADVMETKQEAEEAKDTREDQRDGDDLITLDSPD